MKKINKSNIIILLIMSISILSLTSITYAKFVYQQNIQNTITVPEYNHCIANGITNLSDCILVNEDDYLTVDAAKSAIALKNVDYTTPSTSDEGLLKETDNHGDTYYFRGLVEDNYIIFANHTWRIVRINGDGSTRIIYAGTTPRATGGNTTIGLVKYNDTTDVDMAYVGYKYGLEKSYKATTLVTYDNIDEDNVYSFGTSFTCDETTHNCVLSGEITTGKWSEIYQKATGNDGVHYQFTCWQSEPTTSCNIVTSIAPQSFSGTTIPTSLTVNYVGYISSTYESTLTNVYDSTIKTATDTWYAENILTKNDSYNNSFANYLSDTGFCNDRSLGVGDGNTLQLNSVYGAYRRNGLNKQPSLMCSSNVQDLLTVANNGYGTLSFPIGLITADEVAMSGTAGKIDVSSTYLDEGINIWTMSPAYFKINLLTSNNFILSKSSSLTTLETYKMSYLRPVVNLSQNVKVTGGNGTETNPYRVTIN